MRLTGFVPEEQDSADPQIRSLPQPPSNPKDLRLSDTSERHPQALSPSDPKKIEKKTDPKAHLISPISPHPTLPLSPFAYPLNPSDRKFHLLSVCFSIPPSNEKEKIPKKNSNSCHKPNPKKPSDNPTPLIQMHTLLCPGPPAGPLHMNWIQKCQRPKEEALPQTPFLSIF